MSNIVDLLKSTFVVTSTVVRIIIMPQKGQFHAVFHNEKTKKEGSGKILYNKDPMQ